MELLPPPPFLQAQAPFITNYTAPEPTAVTTNDNDHQVPYPDILPKPNPTCLPTFPSIVHSNDADIDEIELSSDDDVQDRTPAAPMSYSDEPTSIADELVQTNQSSSALPLPTEMSNSQYEDTYEQASDPSLSSPPASDTRFSAQEQATTR